MAEREGFEPSRPLRAYGISSAAPSTELGDRSATILANYAQRLARSTAAWQPEALDQSWGGGLDRATAPRPFCLITWIAPIELASGTTDSLPWNGFFDVPSCLQHGQAVFQEFETFDDVRVTVDVDQHRSQPASL